MKKAGISRIDGEAVLALAEWRSCFTEQVVANAKQISAESDVPGRITLEHYRQAAKIAIETLTHAVEDEDPRNGLEEAA